jgi:hypothetical protein
LIVKRPADFLRVVADGGVPVSAHPAAILKIGTKNVSATTQRIDR